LEYHGYIFTLPPPLDSVAAYQKVRKIGVNIIWFDSTRKELSRAGIEQYCVYRLDPDTTEFKRIAEVPASDTVYLDSDVGVGDTVKYFVTAIDSNWLESNPSDTITWVVTHWLLVSDTDEASAYGKKIERDSNGDIYIVYTAFDSIYHVSSTDKGSSWSGKPIGEGEYPCIDLDSNDKSNVVWMWYSPPGEILESILYFSRKTAFGWADPDTLWDYPGNSGVPCFQIDDDDTGHVVWNSYPQFGPGKWSRGGSELDYGYFYTQAAPPTFSDTTIDSDYEEVIEIPSLAIDSTNFDCHVVYSKDDNIYYIKVNTSSWTTPQRISDSSNNSGNPYIEYDKNSSKIHVVWQQDKGGNSQIMHTSKTVQTGWRRPVVACSTSYNSVNPVITSGEFIFWSEEITNNSEIYYSRYSGGSWGSPALVKNTTEDSKFPHATYIPDADSDTVFVTWTDGDSMPYIIEFKELNFAKQQSLFSGHISENTTWSSDIVIKGDVWIDPGVTLTINPGVHVKFEPNYDDKQTGVDPTRAEFIVQGNLTIRGNDSLPVVFTSNARKPKAGDWYGIRFIPGEKKKVEKRMEQPTLSEKSILGRNKAKISEGKKNTERIQEKKHGETVKAIQLVTNLRIEYANIGLLLDRPNKTIIRECDFQNNKTGLKVIKDAAVDIMNCDFSGNTDYGIAICSDAYGTIKGCKVLSGKTGIIFLGSEFREAEDRHETRTYDHNESELETKFGIAECKIIDNSDYGICIVGNAKPDFGAQGHNYICGNGKYDLFNDTENDINAKGNYWGTINIDSCKAHIHDYFDNSLLGTVWVEPLWNGNHESEGTMESGKGKVALRNLLNAASPTPFLKNTKINYSIANPGYISLCIYDISGRLVRTLCNEKKDANTYRASWNGRDNSGSKVSTGIYFIRLATDDFVAVKKVMVVR